MKRLILLLCSFVFLMSSCSKTTDNSATDPSYHNPVDLSYDNINNLTDFKCYISHNDNIATIDGSSAKELYKLIWDAKGEEIYTTSNADGDYVYMVFYNSLEEYPSENINEFFGTYTVSDDGILTFSVSPYQSLAFDYKLNSNIFNSILDIISPQVVVNSFSYTSDCDYYKNSPGVKQSGFINNEKSKIDCADQVVDLAKRECTIEYDAIDVAYDSISNIYRISFYKEKTAGGSQDVYIDTEGITQLIIYSE